MILLKNGTYIDWKTLEFRKTDLLVEEGAIGGFTEMPGKNQLPEGLTLDCTGMYITRAFANGHHHIYSQLARGMPPPAKQPTSFREILQYVWWNLDKALDREMIHASAMAAAIDCAKRGVTFVIDHHASPNAVEESLAIIAEAFDTVGISHLLCYEISDRDGTEVAAKGLAETERYLKYGQGLVGLHASFTIDDQTLAKAVRLAERSRTGIHIHVAEDPCDQQECLANHRKRVVERLADAGVLRFPQTILAHCLHLDDHERALVAGSPCYVVQNTESNLNNLVGFFNGTGLGKNVMLGTDGMHSDMMQSARAAWFSGHPFERIDLPGAYQRLRNVHHYIAGNGFTGDGENNLVILDYPTPTPFSRENFYGHFFYGLESSHIRHVISAGRLIVKDRKVCAVDEQECLEQARVQAARLWSRMKTGVTEDSRADAP